MLSKDWIKYAKIERVCLFSDVIDTYLFKYKSASAKMCAAQFQKILYFLLLRQTNLGIFWMSWPSLQYKRQISW